MKTGLSGGRALQLPLYLLVGGSLLEVDTSTARPPTTSSPAGAGSGESSSQASSSRQQRASSSRCSPGSSTGSRAATSIPSPDEHCRYCDYTALCDVGRRRIIERKRDDPRVAVLPSLREIG